MSEDNKGDEKKISSADENADSEDVSTVQQSNPDTTVPDETETDTKQTSESEDNETKPTTNEGELDVTENEDLTQIDPALIERLSFGLLEKCLPSLQKAKSVLDDVLQNQGILIDSVQQENAKFDECKAMAELTETMNQAKKYHSKLVSIKKEMNTLSEKSFKIKKRALKLQQQKQKEDLQRVQQLDRDQERERALEAKVVRRSNSQGGDTT